MQKDKVRKQKIVIPTYPVGEGEALPLFFEKRPYQGASGKVYPIPYVSRLSDEKGPKSYDAIILENEYVRVECLPELGGKINGAVDKTNHYEYIYRNKVIKPAMVGLAGPWVSGGIEFNFPQHHRPTTFMPAESAVRGSHAYMGEVDYFHAMKGMVALSLEGSALKAEITVYNGTPTPHPFMWWANMAVEVNSNYRIVFPPDAEFVNDHDRRAVLEWPIARGVYHTARPFDYGEGTDIHDFSAVKVPSSFMISRGQSDGDFVSGYDVGKAAGVVTVAEHRVAPGKKLWTWGDNTFGSKWCANLTDDGSRYVELMTGCYTDNQPDFTRIDPYETKRFTQIWYPVRDIGEVKCANSMAAVNLEKRGEKLFLGIYCPQERQCRLTLVAKEETVWSGEAHISPSAPFCTELSAGYALEELTLILQEAGKEILRYRQPVRGTKKPILPRKPAPRPSEVASLEELWLHGSHLRRYKHFAYRAEDYFCEALSRDATDIRCNEEMGELLLERGDFEGARKHFTAAIEKLTMRHPNPYDTQPYYLRALCAFRENDLDGAYEDAYAAIWSYPMRSAGYYLLGKIEARRGNIASAISFLRLSLETNAGHLWAEHVLGILKGDSTIDRRIRRRDPLFFPGPRDARRALGFAIEYADFGLYARARDVLLAADDCALKYYHLAYLSALLKDGKRDEYLRLAEESPWEREFPSRVESAAVLKSAGTPMANYYLGCLYYSFDRYAEAAEAWENAVKAKEFGPAYRNLSLALYDHLARKDEAKKCLERAHELLPENDRVFYELTQLYKSLNLPLAERLALYEKNASLTALRDDCTLGHSVLLTVKGDYEAAEKVLFAHRFHTYEGGEGYLTQHHAWLHLLIGKNLIAKGDHRGALEALESGLVFPKNYGEEKNYFVNDAPLYYHIALCRKALGDEAGAQEALRLADGTKGAPTVHSYYRVLALRALGKEEEANMRADEMIAAGSERLSTADIDDYYGVGAPAYPPFGYDITRAHTLSGNLMLAFGYLARGDKARAAACAAVAREIDSCEFLLALFDHEND